MSRRAALAKIRARLVDRGYPRLVVLTLIVLSGLAAFGFSTLLFRLGVEHIGYRYLAATAVGYAVFLWLLALWVEMHRRSEVESSFDVLDLPGGGLPDMGGAGVEFSGGASGGAGASGSWEGPEVPSIGIDVPDADEAWPVVVIVAVAAIVLLGGIIALFYVVYSAPLLLAEIALDAALVTGIYRRLRKQDTGNWVGSAIRRTWKPAVIIAGGVFVLGVILQWMMPSAQTIGDLVR